MLHWQEELVVFLVGPKYTFEEPDGNGDNINPEEEKNILLVQVDAWYSQQNLPLLKQVPPRATTIVHGDWPKELNNYSNQIQNYATSFKVSETPSRRTEVYPERQGGAWAET